MHYYELFMFDLLLTCMCYYFFI